MQRFVEKVRPGSLKDIATFFGWIPADLRTGPWALPPLLVFACSWVMVTLAFPRAWKSFEPVPEATELRQLRFAFFAYGTLVLAWMFKRVGWWPMISWTMAGWNLAVLRFLLGALELRGLQRLCTFPALLANTVTVTLWYCAIVPGLACMRPKGQRLEAAKGWVLDPLLFTVHGLNLPYAILDWYWQPVRLTFFDLWAGTVYGLLYLSWYLFVLDPVGLHLYFILSPRKWWGAAVYLSIIGFAVVLWMIFNWAESTLTFEVEA